MSAKRKISTQRRKGADVRTCGRCGCTDSRACPGGCHWLLEDLDICSQCLSPDEVDMLDELAGNIVAASNDLDGARSTWRHAVRQQKLFKHILRTNNQPKETK